ncbi:phage tail tube protein [Aeromicrobium sp.]|uniref:phage tail tube protein n=1 Tax=Aeromicrobium sp. TaxID=1871063 RepID=UPI002FC81263
MGAMDYQLGVVDESTYATPVTVTRFFEYNEPSTPIKAVAGRTEGNPLRVGSRARRSNRVVPYLDHAEGTIALDVMTKGFGFWLKHMLPDVATSGAGPYTHTATEGTSSLAIGKSFTAQFNEPFNPAGTNQAVTFSGGKVTKWTLSNSVEEMLLAELECDFAAMSTGIALATASYPASMDNFHWVGGVVSVGGSAIDITDIKVEVNLSQKTGRKAIKGSATQKEPTPGPLEITFAIEADFDSLTQWNRVHSTTVSGLSAAIVGTWTNGTNTLVVTIPSARFDDLDLDDDTGLKQTLTGVGEYDGTLTPITVAYTTSEATP